TVPARYRMIRLQGTTPSGVASSYPAMGTFAVAEGGFTVFQSGGNSYSWRPTSSEPHSLLAESKFAYGSNIRFSFNYSEPVLIGANPGPSDGYALNFWDKTMIFHEGSWQEAVELGDADLLTRHGIAFYGKGTNNVEIW